MLFRSKNLFYNKAHWTTIVAGVVSLAPTGPLRRLQQTTPVCFIIRIHMSAFKNTECMSVWLDGLLWEQEAVGSNPTIPTKLWSRSINGDAVDCKSAAYGMPGSIPGYSTRLCHSSSFADLSVQSCQQIKDTRKSTPPG